MEQSKLPELPESSNKEFWGDAEMHTNIVPQKVKFLDQPHIFIQVKGHEAQCQHCDWGFPLDPGDKIRDGHLFDREGKLVI